MKKIERMKTFQTERTIARHLQNSDFDLLHLMHTNPQVMATLGGVRTVEKTQENLQWNLDQWEQHGFGLWMFFNKENQQFVSRAGIRKLEILGKQQVELAYALMPECWGQGYATEIAKAILGIAFNYYQLPELICFTLTTNLSSQKVMQKIGFHYESEFILYDNPHVLYRLSAHDYKRHVK